MRRAPRLLVLALVAAAGCARPTVHMTTSFDLTTDGGAPRECTEFADLACVNFIKFQIEEEGTLTPPTECITVDKRLTNLCDVSELAHGTEIFRYDRDARVRIKMWGLRVFPATSCEIIPDCPPKSLFDGTSDAITAGEAHGEVPLHITFAKGCGAKEEYRPRGGRDCYRVCDYTEPVCELRDGCVCLLPDSRADGGAPDVGAL